MDFISDIGGVFEIMIVVVGILIYPLSKQAFVLKMVKLLYRVRTSDRLLLSRSDQAKINPQTGKLQKQVRFEFSSDDENGNRSRKEIKQRELDKRKLVLLKTS